MIHLGPRAWLPFVLVPLVFGAAIAAGLEAKRQNAHGLDREGADIFLAFGGITTSLIISLSAVLVAPVMLRRSPVSFPLFAIFFYAAMLPVGYFQCVNDQSGAIFFFYLVRGIDALQYQAEYPLLVSEAAMVYSAAVLAVAGVLYLGVRGKR